MNSTASPELDKLPYPKLPRHLDRRFKLTDKQRDEIRAAHKRGESYKPLADKYGVSESTIWRICGNPERVAFWNKRSHELTRERIKHDKEYRKRCSESHQRTIERKKELLGDPMVKYIARNSLRWFRRHRSKAALEKIKQKA